MKHIYGNKLCYYETNLRSEKFIDRVIIFNDKLFKSQQDKLKHGEDVLIETYLLSVCLNIFTS